MVLVDVQKERGANLSAREQAWERECASKGTAVKELISSSAFYCTRR